jgi:CRP-like cAMP-binding protein
MNVRNRLLLELSVEDCDAVLARAEFVQLAVGTILQEAHNEAEFAYFPNDGLASIVALMADGSMTEGASVGRDGFIGSTLVLGTRHSTARVIWQVPGSAYRIPAPAFLEMNEQGIFGGRLLGFLQEALDQTTQVAACNRRHTILQRAARWLLMVHDRVDGTTFMLTQEFLATMLGVGRPKVTLAAQGLQRAGLISYRRGVVSVLDRKGLEQLACECYGVLAGTYPGQ